MSESDASQKRRPAGKPTDGEPGLEKRSRVVGQSDVASIGTLSSGRNGSIAYRWLDGGSSAPDGKVYHQGIVLTVQGKVFEIQVRHAVRLWSSGTASESEAEGSIWEANWFARVEALWESPSEDQSLPRCKLRWFYTESQLSDQMEDLDSVSVTEEWSQARKSVHPEVANEHDLLVMSDHIDENDIASIYGPLAVKFLSPDSQIAPQDAPFCRFIAEDAGGTWKISPWSEQFAKRDADRLRIQEEKLKEAELESSEDSVSSDEHQRAAMPEGEGSNLRGDIQVGEMHQVEVGDFVPGQTVRSRGPLRVWTPGQISEDDMQRFLDKLAEVHSKYLKEAGLTMEEPYCPLRSDQEEELMRESPGYRPLTGSTVSSASSLSARRNNLLKECDVDEVLQILHQHNYNRKEALSAIEKDLHKVSSGWTRAEKKLFDDGFRQSQGSLRSISKVVAETRNHKGVVDYWYRFKIADQFRLYQNKKREQAIRIIECIDKRRYHDTVTADHEPRRKKPWNETSAREVTGAVEERCHAAKSLLLDVQQQLGNELMKDIASVVRDLSRSYSVATRNELFTLLQGHPELKKRFLDFLPKSA